MAQKEGNWFKRHKVLTVLMSIVVLGIIIGAARGGGSDNTANNTNNNGSEEAAATAETAKIGSAVRDGKFEFVVKSIECGKTVVGADYLTKQPQGQFCLLALRVTNIGDTQQYFSDSDQKLLNSEGTQYSPDSTATLYHSNNSNVWLAQINPGNSVEGVLVFDIPKDQTPTHAQLHDSFMSNGVKVSLQ